MEDSGSILWIIALLGALFFSAGGKARKKAKEAAKRAIRQLEEEGRRHEAWPSWDTPEEAHETAGEPRRSAPAASRNAVPGPVDARSADPFAPQPAAFGIEPEYETAASDRSSTLMGQISLTDRSEMDSITGRTVQTDFGKTSSVSGVDSRKRTEAGEIPAEETAAEITEEFDLRRAVIYSEILKPKFDE